MSAPKLISILTDDARHRWIVIGRLRRGAGGHAWAVVNGVVLDDRNLFKDRYNKKPSVVAYYKITGNCRVGSYGQGRSTWQNRS